MKLGREHFVREFHHRRAGKEWYGPVVLWHGLLNEFHLHKKMEFLEE